MKKSTSSKEDIKANSLTFYALNLRNTYSNRFLNLDQINSLLSNTFMLYSLVKTKSKTYFGEEDMYNPFFYFCVNLSI